MPRSKTTGKPDTEATENQEISAELLEANQALDVQNAELHEENEALRKKLDEADADIEARIKKAISELVPTSFQKMYGTEEFQTGQDGVRTFDDNNAIIKPERVTLDDPFFKAKADELAFMEEPVKISIARNIGDNKKEIGFPVTVNRETVVLMKGGTYTVKRKFVSAMLEMVKTDFDSVDNPNREDTSNLYLYPEMSSIRFPFAVIEDKNPRGMAWLEAKQRQA